MCGIAGIVAHDGQMVHSADVRRMTDSLLHRGPDGEGIWISPDSRCGLGHRRLAIIDIDRRADQPMLSDPNRYAIVFNGEIYNFLEVRKELEAKGYRFRTESDTEVLLNAWQAWGPAMMPRLNGMWAIAIFDNETGELFLARDRFGVKPLLYTTTPGRIAFASEMRALLTLPWLDRKIDAEVAQRIVFDPFSVEASARTMFRDIARLPAGHCLTLRNGTPTISRWWNTTDHLIAPPANLADAAEEFHALFADAVRLRMRSDVPIGTCLSGGFDSSAVAATMADIANQTRSGEVRQSRDWRHAFVATFPGLGHDETAEAQIAADYAGIEPHMFDLSRDAAEEHLDEVMDTMEDVFIGLPTAVWKIYRAVNAHGIHVSIDGHGADEMIGAYRTANQPLQFLMRNMLGNASGRGKFLMGVNDHVKLAYLKLKGSYFLRSGLSAPPAFEIAANADRLPDDWGVLNRRLYGMFHATILPTLLRNFDRLSMAHSVEVRMPFMDWRLATFALSLPDSMKADSQRSKLIAREAMRGRMPEQIRAATRKVGFGSQMPDWLNTSLGPWALRRLSTPNAMFDDLVDRQALTRRVEQLSSNKNWNWETAGRLWPYVALKWYLDRHAAA